MRRVNSLARILPSLVEFQAKELGKPCQLWNVNKLSKRSINYDCFSDRHIGPNELEKQQMLNYLGFKVRQA